MKIKTNKKQIIGSTIGASVMVASAIAVPIAIDSVKQPNPNHEHELGDNVANNALGETPAFDVSPTAINEEYSIKSADGQNTYRLHFERTSLTFAFDVGQGDQALFSYIEDNANNDGWAPLVDAYSQGLVTNIMLGMRNNHSLANFVVTKNNEQTSHTLMLSGLNLIPRTKSITWRTADTDPFQITVTYSSDDFILHNMSIAKNANSKNSFLLAITKEINFNMSISVEGTTYSHFCVGTEPTDVTIPLVDNSLNQHLLGANGSAPISSSNSICALDVPSLLTRGDQIRHKQSSNDAAPQYSSPLTNNGFVVNIADITFRDLQNNSWLDRDNGQTIVENLWNHQLVWKYVGTDQNIYWDDYELAIDYPSIPDPGAPQPIVADNNGTKVLIGYEFALPDWKTSETHHWVDPAFGPMTATWHDDVHDIHYQLVDKNLKLVIFEFTIHHRTGN